MIWGGEGDQSITLQGVLFGGLETPSAKGEVSRIFSHSKELEPKTKRGRGWEIINRKEEKSTPGAFGEEPQKDHRTLPMGNSTVNFRY